jgi:hypothetical protein
MDAPTAATGKAEALEHPLYRIAHLHGSEWVTLRPEAQHSPRQDEPDRPWADATIYRCDTCDERVIVAPA